MSKLFGVVIINALVEEVIPKGTRKHLQRTLFNGTIVRIERTLSDDTHKVRCLKDNKDSWETIQFNCPKDKCQIVPEDLWQYLAAIESPLERVKVAINRERYEKLLMITLDMIVAYADGDNVLLGTVKFIGNVQSIGLCYGIKLHEKKQGTRCNGSIANVQYFNCLPGYGIFATIDKLVAHNVFHTTTSEIDAKGRISPSTASKNFTVANKLSNKMPLRNSPAINAEKVLLNTNSLLQDDLSDNMSMLKSSRIHQPVLEEQKRESINTNNEFDHNTILQSDKLILLNKKGIKCTGGLRNGEHMDKITSLNDSKPTDISADAFINSLEINNIVRKPDSTRTIRNKSLNPILHIVSSSKTISKKRKEPTFKSYDSEFNQACQERSLESPKPNDDAVPYIQPASALTNDITIGTLVQIVAEDAPESGELLFGVVRWLGMKKSDSQAMNTQTQSTPTIIIAGVELDFDVEASLDLDFPLTDGTFDGQRRFDTHCGIFIPLSKCRKDKRFLEENNGASVNDIMCNMGASYITTGVESNELNGTTRKFENFLEEMERHTDTRVQEVKRKLYEAENGNPVIKGIVAPLVFQTEEDIKAVCSTYRGIQGHHNSCYLDATLFSMFTFTSVFDSLIYRPRGLNDIPQYDEVQRVLREEIVNPLRSNLFVNAERVMTLRHHLDKLSSISGLTSEEKDPEEFINSLLAQILHAEPFLKLNSGQESYFYQLFVDKDDRLKLPTVQQLFEQSFHTSEIKLKEVPSCLIIQMPRFGKNYKMYPRIIPSQLLDITDIIENSPRGCTICGTLAYYECVRCYDNLNNSSASTDVLHSGLENTAFCSQCVQTFHQPKHRADHKPRLLDLPPDYQFLVEAGHESAQPPRLCMDLFAVVCIETSHYVAFVKCGNDTEAPWCFFDSMADRKGEKNGFNIPSMVACPDVSKWLADEQSCHLMQRDIPSDRHLPEHARRLLCDAYICMYQKTDVMMYK